jgi:hypothetical protein
MTAIKYEVVRAVESDEIRLRRFFASKDEAEWAVHSQLKDYFMTSAVNFGACLVKDGSGKIASVAMYSIFRNVLYIHEYLGVIEHLELIRQHHGLPVQIILREGLTPMPTESWRAVLDVRPGMIVDHPAYSGVFWRTAPRYSGIVYESID